MQIILKGIGNKLISIKTPNISIQTKVKTTSDRKQTLVQEKLLKSQINRKKIDTEQNITRNIISKEKPTSHSEG